MISDGKKWHYLVVKGLSELYRGKTLNNDGDFYCVNCFHSFSTKNKLKHKNVCKNRDYCYIEMPKKKRKHIKI